MGALGANVAVAVAVLLCGLSLLLAIVAWTSWRRIGHGRLFWVGAAFAGFAAKGVWLILDSYGRRGELAAGWDGLAWLGVVDLAIVVMLYVAVLQD